MCLNIFNTISNLSANITLCSVALVTPAKNTPSSASKNRNANVKNIVESNKPKFNTEFIEWFVGLCDAEANFLILRKNKLGQIIGFEFILELRYILTISKF